MARVARVERSSARLLEPSEPELNSNRFDADKVKSIRSRLSDISCWTRLLCQRIAQKANFEEKISGKFWQNRYRAVRLIDEEAMIRLVLERAPAMFAVATRDSLRCQHRLTWNYSIGQHDRL